MGSISTYVIRFDEPSRFRRSKLLSVTSQQRAVRTTLVQTLDFIFPIEPISSQELLFAILDVPLPLPSGTSDPAPPLSLSDHPEVNEQSTASALGYAAQLVHLVSIYHGRILPYPITYAASRSMIRDPISTMQGPRMYVHAFPILLFESG